MKCNDPEMQKRLSLYQFNLLDESERTRVEAHLLECETCLQAYYEFRPVAETLKVHGAEIVAALQKESLFRRMLKLVKRNVVPPVLKGFNLIRAWWQKPVIKFLVPVTVTALLAIFLLKPSATSLSDLALIEKAPYLDLHLKSEHEYSTVEKLFMDGMQSYVQDDFSQAIRQLTEYTAAEKENAYGHFYLGVSLLLTNATEKGIEHLQLAADLCQDQGIWGLLEQCYWYLGNGYLKLGERERALEAFRRGIYRQGRLTVKFHEQIEKIKK